MKFYASFVKELNRGDLKGLLVLVCSVQYIMFNIMSSRHIHRARGEERLERRVVNIGRNWLLANGKQDRIQRINALPASVKGRGQKIGGCPKIHSLVVARWHLAAPLRGRGFHLNLSSVIIGGTLRRPDQENVCFGSILYALYNDF